MTDVERFQQLKNKVDAYNTSVIEKELKQKQMTEELDKLLADLKTLGYNSIEEATAAYNELETKVKTSLDEMEAKLNGV